MVKRITPITIEETLKGITETIAQTPKPVEHREELNQKITAKYVTPSTIDKTDDSITETSAKTQEAVEHGKKLPPLPVKRRSTLYKRNDANNLKKKRMMRSSSVSRQKPRIKKL